MVVYRQSREHKPRQEEARITPDSEKKKAWIKENTTFIGLKLNNNTDAEIIKKLESVESKQGYIKSLIRSDIEKGEKHGH